MCLLTLMFSNIYFAPQNFKIFNLSSRKMRKCSKFSRFRHWNHQILAILKHWTVVLCHYLAIKTQWLLKLRKLVLSVFTLSLRNSKICSLLSQKMRKCSIFSLLSCLKTSPLTLFDYSKAVLARFMNWNVYFVLQKILKTQFKSTKRRPTQQILAFEKLKTRSVWHFYAWNCVLSYYLTRFD